MLELLSDYHDKVPSIFYVNVIPDCLKGSSLVVFNEELACDLGMDARYLMSEPGIFSGCDIQSGWTPIAQAYSGHQFGYFTRLGDGRAVLLGEWQLPDGNLIDIQLKGSGMTPYSRGGDGKAGLGPMLREYLISEAMHNLGIPTSRSLAVSSSSESVYRQNKQKRAILTRVLDSHIRVGTFQYGYEIGKSEAIKHLADYSIQRHYPGLADSSNKYLEFINVVIDAQAKLIALWMSKGFIHGVMNTDNMTICGKTIDYGPCAFMDRYDSNTVFSSIDVNGRYKYSNQPKVAKWNLCRFAELFIDLVGSVEQEAFARVSEAVNEFDRLYDRYFLKEMTAKLGIKEYRSNDRLLVYEILELMTNSAADFTNTFYHLTTGEYYAGEFLGGKASEFLTRWKKRLKEENGTEDEIMNLMRSSNPKVIPRNQAIEESLKAAELNNDFSVFNSLSKTLRHPYDYEREVTADLMKPMDEDMRRLYKTYCGT